MYCACGKGERVGSMLFTFYVGAAEGAVGARKVVKIKNDG
ncbi:hypothetical protein PRJ_1307 [Pseudomonas sp. XWY-1]|nr:hypothetical protein PRJ_1307 [Pseudomonas sp. XWY-1]